jgi:hypothetical protein
MLDAIPAHLAVVATWLACGAVAWGVGRLIHGAVLTPAAGAEPDSLEPTWTGLAAIVLFLHLWHFVFPVDGRALVVILAAGIAGGLMTWLRSRGAKTGTAPATRRALYGQLPRAAALLAVGLWLANRSLSQFQAHDSGMYMIPAVEWITAYPLVPGLGALHGRLAFNSANALLAALLEAGPWPPASPHLLNGLFLFLFAARISRHVTVAGRAGRPTTAAFDLVLAGPLVVIVLDRQLLPSLSADVAVAVALFAGVSMLLDRATKDRSAAEDVPSPPLAAMAAFALAFTLKLSAAVFALAGSAIAVTLLMRRSGAGAFRRRGRIAIATGALALAGCWLIRSVWLSGYPMYPARLLSVPVEWRLPRVQVEAEAAWVSHFGRTWYSTDLANADSVGPYTWRQLHWLGPWTGALLAGRDRGMISLPAALLLVLIPAGFALDRRPATRRRSVPAETSRRLPGSITMPVIAAPAVASAIYWFVAAPRPSLGFPAAWTLAALALAGTVRRLDRRHAWRATVAAGILVPAIAAAAAVRNDYPRDFWTARAWRWTLLADADPTDWFREGPPPEYTTFTTDDGTQLNVPVSNNICLRTPLPCTPHPAANLRAREANSLRDGFVVSGAWQPQRWPNRSSQFLRSWLTRRASDGVRD